MRYFKRIFATLFFVLFMTNYTTEAIQKAPNSQAISSNSEVMSEDDIAFNGRHHRALSITEYKRIYQKPERRGLVATEDLCTSNFEDDPNSQFYFNKGIKFEDSKNKVIVDEFKFTQGNFLNFKKHRFSNNTTLDLIAKLFPKAFSNLKTIQTAEHGVMECLTLEETLNSTSDGKILLFFKKNHLYMMQWWMPC